MAASDDSVLISHYLEAYDLRSIYIISDHGTALVGSARDPRAAFDRAQAYYGRGIYLERVWWTFRPDATALHFAWAASLRTVEETERGIVHWAVHHGIPLQPDDHVMTQAREVVAYVKTSFENMRKNGELKNINQTFKNERQRRHAHSLPAISYHRFVLHSQARMLRSIAKSMGAIHGKGNTKT